MNLKQWIVKCEEFGFNEQIIRETLWNEGYKLGRKRWYWGPAWFVNLQGWINTRRQMKRAREVPTVNENLIAERVEVWREDFELFWRVADPNVKLSQATKEIGFKLYCLGRLDDEVMAWRGIASK